MRLTDTDRRALQVLRVRQTFTELRAALGISDTAHRRGRVLDQHLQAMVREGWVRKQKTAATPSQNRRGAGQPATYQTTANGAKHPARLVAAEQRRRARPPRRDYTEPERDW